MKDRIINLVGPSGSGKTTIAKELEKLGYNIIMSYTTREPREPNEWGHKFIHDWYPVNVNKTVVGFENDVDVNSMDYRYIDIDDMIAYKEIYGDHYFATKEQYQGKGTSVYVVDPDGAKQVDENVKDADIVTVFLWADENKRMYRMMNREEKKECYPSKKTVERLNKDREIFKVCKCDYTVDANREVKEVLEGVVSIIGGR